MMKKQQRRQQQQSIKPPKEKPLDTFIPTNYLALLEGTLLPNGDLEVSPGQACVCLFVSPLFMLKSRNQDIKHDTSKQDTGFCAGIN